MSKTYYKNLYIKIIQISLFFCLSFSVTLYAQNTVPFMINGGKPLTSDPIGKVLIQIYTPGFNQMMISNDESFAGAKWKAYQSRISWRLDGAEDGMKSVYVKFRDASGNTSDAYTRTIELDRTPPQNCEIVIDGGSEYTDRKDRRVRIEFLAEEATRMMVSNRDDFMNAHWMPYKPAYEGWLLTAVDGRKRVFAKFKDAAGNTTDIVTDDIKMDRQPPKGGAVIINSDSMYTTKRKVRLKIKGNGADKMIIKGVPQWIDYKPLHEIDLPGEDGDKIVYMKLKDHIGNQSRPFYDHIILDTRPPKSGSVKINSDQSYTRSYKVGLKLLAMGADQMMISNNPAFRGAFWRPYSSKIPKWPLKMEEGKRVVYVKFKDNAGNITKVISDYIRFDKTAPTPISVKIVETGDPKDKEKNIVNLQIKQKGALFMMVSNVSTFYGAKWQVFKPTVKGFQLGGEGDGEKHVYVKFSDRAGNVSKAVSDMLVIDREGPVNPKLLIDGGHQYCRDKEGLVKLSLFAQGNPTEINVSNTVIFDDQKWFPYTNSRMWALGGMDGKKTIHAIYRDAYGNNSDTVTAEIILDRTPPTEASIRINHGQEVTNNDLRQIIIEARAKDAKFMRFSNSKNFREALWVRYSEKVVFWKLSPGDGQKMVYAQFKDEAGNITPSSKIPSSSIKLDTKPPLNAKVEAYLNGKLIQRNEPINTHKVDLKLFADGAHQMRIGNNLEFEGKKWMPFKSEIKDYSLPYKKGLKIIYVQFRDTTHDHKESQGNVSKKVYVQLGVDIDAPTGGVVYINYDHKHRKGNPYTTNVDGKVNLTLRANGASHMMISQSSVFGGMSDAKDSKDWIPYNIYVQNYQLEGEDGDKTVYVKFKDRAGNVTSPVSAQIKLDRQGPFDGELIINGGEEKFTTNPNMEVKLQFKATGADYFMVSNSKSFRLPAKWEKYQQDITKNWFLAQGEGSKTVYIRFKDEAGNVSQAYDASIVVDTRPPVVTRFAINGGKSAFTTDSNVTLNIKAVNAFKMRVSSANDFTDNSGGWEPYKSQKEWTVQGEVNKPIRVFIKCKDEAGNISEIKFADITITSK